MSSEQLRPQVGAASGRNIIGEVTESVHKFRMDRYNLLHRDRPLRSPRRARIPNSAED